MGQSLEEKLIAKLEFQEMCEVNPVKEPITKAALDLLEKDISAEPQKTAKPYTKGQLSKVKKLLKEFLVPKEMYAEIPASVVTYDQLLNWKNRILFKALDKYNG